MKFNKKILLFVFIFLIFISSSTVYADTPSHLRGAEILSNSANRFYEIARSNNFDISFNYDEILMKEIAYNFMILFFIASLIDIFTDFNKLTATTIFKKIAFLLFAIIAIENVEIIFEASEYLKDFLVDSNFDFDSTKLVDFTNVKEQWDYELSRVDGIISNVRLIQITVAFTLSTLIINLIAIALNVILLLRNFQLFLLRMFSPIFIASVAHRLSLGLAKSFTIKYFSTEFKIVYIVFFTNLFLEFGGSESIFIIIFQSLGLFISVLKVNKFYTYLKGLGSKMKNRANKISNIISSVIKNLK